MIQVIAGNKGSGKTKRLIDVANDALKSEQGTVVFLDVNKSYMYDLRHEVRFVDVGEFDGVCGSTAEVFLGFLSGMLSVNYDISLVCIDAFVKIIAKTALTETEAFFSGLNKLTEKFGCNFVLNITGDAELLPSYVTAYLI